MTDLERRIGAARGILDALTRAEASRMHCAEMHDVYLAVNKVLEPAGLCAVLVVPDMRYDVMPKR